MSREEIYSEMRGLFGLVPSFFKAVPDSILGNEWELYKKLEVDEGPVPAKCLQLIGLGIAAATKCRYCTLYHTEMAKLHGATQEEIDCVLAYTKLTTGWSSFVNGLQLDFDTFRAEIQRACEHVRATQKIGGHVSSGSGSGEGVSEPFEVGGHSI